MKEWSSRGTQVALQRTESKSESGWNEALVNIKVILDGLQVVVVGWGAGYSDCHVIYWQCVLTLL